MIACAWFFPLHNGSLQQKMPVGYFSGSVCLFISVGNNLNIMNGSFIIFNMDRAWPKKGNGPLFSNIIHLLSQLPMHIELCDKL